MGDAAAVVIGSSSYRGIVTSTRVPFVADCSTRAHPPRAAARSVMERGQKWVEAAPAATSLAIHKVRCPLLHAMLMVARVLVVCRCTSTQNFTLGSEAIPP